MTPSFLITGTGRNASAYIARVLTEAGMPCGHERWFNPYGIRDPTFVGESSCFALPVGLYGFGGRVWHQVRHPLDVISSLMRDPPAGPALYLYRRIIKTDAPEGSLEFSARAWLTYTREADRRACLTWRVDQISPQLIAGLFSSVDCRYDKEAALAALASVPTNYNPHLGDRQRVCWHDLVRHDLKLANRIFLRAQYYGFEL